MVVYKIPEALYPKYKGAGYAVVSVLNGQLTDIVYLRDIYPEFDDGVEANSEQEKDKYVKSYLTNHRTGPTIRYLQLLGEVSFGLCSCYEFIEM